MKRPRQARLIWLVVGIVLLGAVSAWAATINVNPGDDIQAAIDVATAGDTIQLAAGVHNVAATIDVNKSVTIEGIGAATVQGTTSAARILFRITASDVTLRDLDITLTSTYPLAPTELEDSLIGIPDSSALSGVVISGNALYWPAQAGAMSGWGGRAITVGSSGSTDITITGNTVYDIRNGIVLRYGNTGVVSDNLVYNTKGGIMQYTSNQADADSRTMTGNTWGTARNEWDIVWNSATYDPNYVDSVLGVSIVNGDAYVLDRRNSGPPHAVGNRSHIFLNPAGKTTVHEALGNMNDPYATFALGVEAIVEDGTIYVDIGTYQEQVVVNKSAVILGIPGAVIDGGGGFAVVEVAADDTTIAGFEILNGVFGIYVEDSDGLVVQGNIIHDISNPVFPPGTSGVYLQDSDFASITGNTVWNSPGGITLYYCNSAIIAANRVDGADWGIDYYGDDVVVALNSILNGTYGIFTDYDSDDGLIAGNVIAGNETGIYVYAEADPLWWIDYPENTGIHLNSIAGNVVGLEYDIWGDPGLIPALDASLNWWGDASGPSGVGPGTGDSVSTHVIYSPWLGIDLDGYPATPGVQLISPMLLVVDDVGPMPELATIDVPAGLGLPLSGPIVLPAGYLNRAIGASNLLPGTDTIEVRHGTYDASEPITDGVTIVSEVGSAAHTTLNGAVDIRAADVLLGRMRQGFTINGPITVGSGVNALTIHINWNDIYDLLTNSGNGLLDATFNFWGDDGPNTVGWVAVWPLLPETSDTIIGHMDGHGLSALEAIDFSRLLLDGLDVDEALAVVGLMRNFGFSVDSARELIDEYGLLHIAAALRGCHGDYEEFLIDLLGYGVGGGSGGGFLGGGAGGAVGEDGTVTFTGGDLVPLEIQLFHPVTGELVTDALVSYNVIRTLADGSPEIVAFGVMAYNADVLAYVFDLDTSELEPGVYDVYLGAAGHAPQHLQITVTE